MGELSPTVNKGYDIEETSFDGDTNDPQLYNELCSEIVKKLLKLNGELFLFNSDKAIFVPLALFEEFILTIDKLGISVTDNHVWDYELQIGDTIEQMKLIWIVGQKGPPIPIHDNIKYAFNFLQPNYLQYMDKSFCNPDVYTQVNLILDYHRLQKRTRGVEIFNVCDLIKFKMAIDDNRYDYENCEFHKLIDRMLRDTIESGLYMKDGKFDLNKYLSDKHIFRSVHEIFEYLVYHFQNTIGSLYWSAYTQYPIQLSNITNISDFLDNIHATGTIVVTKTDPDGECAKVLYEILTKSKNFINLKFKLDAEWIYSGDCVVNKLTKPLARCEIIIDTKNSFNFVENFINWLKLAFGTRLKCFIELRLSMFETINPYIFNGLCLKELEIRDATLDYKLIKMLTKCRADSIYFINCRIEDDHHQRFEYIGRRRSGCDRNIFKYFDELRNVGFIKLDLEEHTIGILFSYVASMMMTNKLVEFQCINQMWFPNEYKLLFKRSFGNCNVDRIEAYSRRTGDNIDFYELLNRISLNMSDREEFEFYN